MADVECSIQLENRAWDVAPNSIDRLTGRLRVGDDHRNVGGGGRLPVRHPPAAMTGKIKIV